MTPTNQRVSDYKKDIVDLIGIDFEALPLGQFKSVLHKSVEFLPYLMNRNNKMDSEEVEDLLHKRLSEATKDQPEQKESNFLRMDMLQSYQCFRSNYFKRRNGKVACNFRTSLGSYMSKRVVMPSLTWEAQEEMIRAMSKHFPFKLVNRDRMKLMIEAMSKLNVDSGEFLIKEGDFIEKFYYVQCGLFGTVISTDKCYVTEYLKPGQCFGSDYILFGDKSQKTIKCLQAATVWVLESRTYHSVCRWGLVSCNKYLDYAVSRIPGLEGAEAMRLVNALTKLSLEEGKDVLAVTPKAAVYIVFSGEVQVTETNCRGNIITRVCKAGDKFGQDRLFSSKFTKISSAKTLTSSELFYLADDAFHRLFNVSQLYNKSDLEECQDDLFYRTL